MSASCNMMNAFFKRRAFLRGSGIHAAFVVVYSATTSLFGAGVPPDTKDSLAQSKAAINSFYFGNREPLAASPFIKLPIGSITPKGWLRRQLELEANGMIGHLPEISKWCKFEGNAWSDPNGQGHSAWEELPYWLKGYGDLGYVLQDQ